MKQIILGMLCIFAATATNGQSLKKYTISKSGCSAYFFCDPGAFSLEKSPDSSDVYTGECTTDGVIYGVICVKLKDKLADMQEAENMLVAYADYLKGTLKITSAAGYGKGHKLKNSENTRGILDYWKDGEGENWKIKAWTDRTYVVVLYVCTKKEIPESKANIFLDGLVFPSL